MGEQGSEVKQESKGVTSARANVHTVQIIQQFRSRMEIRLRAGMYVRLGEITSDLRDSWISAGSPCNANRPLEHSHHGCTRKWVVVAYPDREPKYGAWKLKGTNLTCTCAGKARSSDTDKGDTITQRGAFILEKYIPTIHIRHAPTAPTNKETPKPTLRHSIAHEQKVQLKKLCVSFARKIELNGQPHVFFAKTGVLPTLLQQVCRTDALPTKQPVEGSFINDCEWRVDNANSKRTLEAAVGPVGSGANDKVVPVADEDEEDEE
ncbi:hypothetical protein B0H10DRAFT_1946816 [Mycena sp. CBHHK59/15]|nr:hypothetical protein B0H10DRAFT_1946816 [Mycena sp. CBHHK59/15]